MLPLKPQTSTNRLDHTPPHNGMAIFLKVVLLGGQGIWYDRLMRGPLGLGDVMAGSSPEAAKASLRRGLKSRLGVEEDRWVVFASP